MIACCKFSKADFSSDQTIMEYPYYKINSFKFVLCIIDNTYIGRMTSSPLLKTTHNYYGTTIKIFISRYIFLNYFLHRKFSLIIQ